MLGGRIGGRRLGILGMGRIGQAVARRAAAFGMQVHYHNRKRLRPEIEESTRHVKDGQTNGIAIQGSFIFGLPYDRFDGIDSNTGTDV